MPNRDVAERILDLVRQVAHQLAVGLLLLGQLFLARGLELLVDRPHFEQQARTAAFHGVTGAIDMQLRFGVGLIRMLRPV